MPQYQILLLSYLYTLPIILFIIYRKRQRVGFFFYLACSLYLLFLCFRPETIGTDTISYKESFECSTYLITDNYEFSWIVICILFDNYFHLGIESVFFIYALITILPIIYVCKAGSLYPYMSLLFFFVTFGLMPFNIMRHCAAMSLCLLTIHFLSKGKNISALCSCALAIIFHNSAIVLVIFVLIIYMLKRTSFSNRTLLLLLWITLLVGFVSFNLMSNVIGMLPSEKYSAYSDYALSRGVNVKNMFIMNIINLCWGSIFLNFQGDRPKSLYYWTYYLSFLIGNFLGYQIGANRVLFFISISSVIFIPNLIGNKEENEYRKRSRIVSFYCLFMILMFFINVLTNKDDINP